MNRNMNEVKPRGGVSKFLRGVQIREGLKFTNHQTKKMKRQAQHRWKITTEATIMHPKEPQPAATQQWVAWPASLRKAPALHCTGPAVCQQPHELRCCAPCLLCVVCVAACGRLDRSGAPVLPAATTVLQSPGTEPTSVQPGSLEPAETKDSPWMGPQLEPLKTTLGCLHPLKQATKTLLGHRVLGKW